MYWNSFSDFARMGGYALYVWGAFGMTALLMILEPWLALRRHRLTRQRIARQARADGARRDNAVYQDSAAICQENAVRQSSAVRQDRQDTP